MYNWFEILQRYRNDIILRVKPSKSNKDEDVLVEPLFASRSSSVETVSHNVSTKDLTKLDFLRTNKRNKQHRFKRYGLIEPNFETNFESEFRCSANHLTPTMKSSLNRSNQSLSNEKHDQSVDTEVKQNGLINKQLHYQSDVLPFHYYTPYSINPPYQDTRPSLNHSFPKHCTPAYICKVSVHKNPDYNSTWSLYDNVTSPNNNSDTQLNLSTIPSVLHNDTKYSVDSDDSFATVGKILNSPMHFHRLEMYKNVRKKLFKASEDDLIPPLEPLKYSKSFLHYGSDTPRLIELPVIKKRDEENKHCDEIKNYREIRTPKQPLNNSSSKFKNYGKNIGYVFDDNSFSSSQQEMQSFCNDGYFTQKQCTPICKHSSEHKTVNQKSNGLFYKTNVGQTSIRMTRWGQLRGGFAR